jgi:tRNA(Ile)-lysidine synthetase-like protein
MPIERRIFVLFPLRHSRIWKNLEFVLQRIREYECYSITDSEKKILQLFKNATLRSFTELEDNIYEGTKSYLTGFNIKDYKMVIDDSCKRYQCAQKYANKRYKLFMENVKKFSIYTTIKNYCINKCLTKICISLSGGVDSMVLLHACKALEIDGVLSGLTAVHMEYINRDESIFETSMLVEWCELLEVPLIIRKIDYMCREGVDRELYEEETRKARFGLYKYMMRKHGVQGFCLGHHHGDLGENVLMNLFKGRDILDLFVMQDDSEIDGVRLLRPLLSHPKSDIYEFAHNHMNEIPYFLDSTPDWSCRGVIRRQVMPALEDQYSGIHGTLALAGERSREWGHIIETMVIKPFLQKCRRTEESMWFEIDGALLSQPRVFWQRVLIEIFHSIGRKMITGKNLDAMLEMLRRRINSNDPLRLNFSNGLTGKFHKNILW